MSVLQIAILACIAVVVGWFGRGRKLALLAVSVLVLYWLQPHQEPVNLMFWLPTLTLALAVVSWVITSTPDARGWKENRGAALVLLGAVVFVNLSRYFHLDFFFPVQTPRFQWIALAILTVFVVAFALARTGNIRPVVPVLAILSLVGLLALVKIPSVLGWLFETVAAIRGKEAGDQSALSWLGFSYVAFRLLHTLLDRIAGRLPAVALADYVNYVVFFPSITAGPIDRLERFTRDLDNSLPLDKRSWLDAGTRLFQGLFKKFVVADALAWIALNEVFIQDVRSPGWTWVLLYAYSFRIYFDFSGYTDIAIGLGRLLGVRLPENFDSPYLKPSLAQFWNSWHMTLTQWFRSYVFNPLTRVMRTAKRPLPLVLMVLLSQVSTMTLIGLWHGVTMNYFLWGVWHGLGLFVQNRWSEWTRAMNLRSRGALVGATFKTVGVLLTFHFVTVGWLFFIFSEPIMVWNAVLKLTGVE